MSNTILIKRGVKSETPKLLNGEIAINHFDKNIYVGGESENIKFINDKNIELLINNVKNEIDLTLDKFKNNVEIPTYNLTELTKGKENKSTIIQQVLNELNISGKGRVLISNIIELESPLTIEKINEDMSYNIEFYGGGCFKKGSGFNGDRLITIKQGFHDEDNIIFNNISFDGVTFNVNGIDNYNSDINYKKDVTSLETCNQSKNIRFINCNFTRCYYGARLSSLSFTFVGCLFHTNIYGLMLGTTANANTFIGCSIRRNDYGVKIKQYSELVGTIGNSFYGCTIESNKGYGIMTEGGQHNRIYCYFENNGWSLSGLSDDKPSKPCHIYYKGLGVVGNDIIGSFFNSTNSEVYLLGDQFKNSTVLVPVTAEFNLINNSHFHVNSTVKVNGSGSYESEYYIGNKKMGTSGTVGVDFKEVDLSRFDDVGFHHITRVNRVVSSVSNLTSVYLFTLNLSNVKKGCTKCVVNLVGANSNGAPCSHGIIKFDLDFINPYTTMVCKENNIIKIDGFYEGSSSIFNSNSTITLVKSGDTFQVYVTNLKNTTVANWGTYTQIFVDVVCESTAEVKKKETHNVRITN